MRCSPPVRMKRSTGGRSARQKNGASVCSEMSSARRRPAATSSGRAPRRIGDVPAAAVIDRDVELQRGVRAGLLHRALHAFAKLGLERRKIADERDAHAVLVQLVDFAIERLQEKLHQRADFALRPIPVLAGEREQRQRLDAAAQAELDRRAHGFLAFAMAQAARPAAPLGPAAVAVHDDRDMARNARWRRVRFVHAQASMASSDIRGPPRLRGRVVLTSPSALLP